VPGASDYSLIAPFRLSWPFARRVAFILEGTPAEFWSVSPPTQEAWSTTLTQGLINGDVRIGARFLLYEGAELLPGLALRVLTKTTSGKDPRNRRFLDAPGYLFDLVAGERWRLSPALELEAWLCLGFLAWQQAGYGQNDALSWSATSLAHLPWGTLLLEARGYQGWQRYDRPLVLMAGLELPLDPHLHLLTSLQRTFRDPQGVELRTSLRLTGLAPW
jgi:hypothetical protein